MGFFTDALRVTGVVAGAALSATGVASPIGAALIGAAVSLPANLGASALERKEANNKADDAAKEAKKKSDEAAEKERVRLENERARLEAQVREEREHAALPNQVLNLCRQGTVQALPQLLQRLDDQQFERLGLTPLSVCPTPVVTNQVAQMLSAEEERRDALRARPRP